MLSRTKALLSLSTPWGIVQRIPNSPTSPHLNSNQEEHFCFGVVCPCPLGSAGCLPLCRAVPFQCMLWDWLLPLGYQCYSVWSPSLCTGTFLEHIWRTESCHSMAEKAWPPISRRGLPPSWLHSKCTLSLSTPYSLCSLHTLLKARGILNSFGEENSTIQSLLGFPTLNRSMDYCNRASVSSLIISFAHLAVRGEGSGVRDGAHLHHSVVSFTTVWALYRKG